MASKSTLTNDRGFQPVSGEELALVEGGGVNLRNVGFGAIFAAADGASLKAMLTKVMGHGYYEKTLVRFW